MIGVCLILVAAAPNPRALLGQLDRLDKALASAETRLEEIATQRVSVQKEIAAMEAELASVTVRQEEAFVRFSRRVRALAAMPAGARLVLLGGSRSLEDYLETTRVLRWIASHDRNLHQRYLTETTRLSELEQAMQQRRQSLIALEEEQRSERDQIAQRRNERLALAQSVLKKKDIAARLARERSTAGRALATMVRKLTPVGRQSSRFARNKSRLPWPTAGEVDVRFGQVLERETGTRTTHNGLDIRASTGTSVQAIGDGEVVYANWLHGYGRIVIIDHGEGYHSLSAHLASIAVSRGERVAQSQSIGTVGDTGSLRGTLLYFEIRHNGMPVDPAAWLRR